MRITNEYKTEGFEFSLIDSEDYLSSHNIQVEVTTKKLTASLTENIWIGQKDIDIFLRELDQLDKDRKTRAVLKSLSPNTFSLVIQPFDDRGNLCAILHYRKQHAFELTVELQLDPGILPQLRIEILQLFTHSASSSSD